MTKNELRRDMRTRTRAIQGMVNLLVDDARYMNIDANDFDLIGLGESIREAKETLKSLTDHIVELEYNLYLLKGEK